MNNSFLFLLIILIFNVNQISNAQNYPDTLADFNNMMLPVSWDTAGGTGVRFDNPCGPALDNSAYLWVGANSYYNPSVAGRIITSEAYDLSNINTICFDFKFAIQAQASPCEGPDMMDEGVSLQFSTDNGSNWLDIIYICPDGNFYTSNSFASDSASPDSTFFSSWSNYCFNLPPAALTQNTIFRWKQIGYSGIEHYDHWGFDNVSVDFLTSSFNKNTIKKPEISIFPNPNKGKFDLLIELQKTDNLICEIFNSSGKMVYSFSENEIQRMEKSIEIDNLSSGLYNLVLKTSNASFEEKFIVR